MLDMSNIPISGGMMMAGALWAGVSAFALGPLVASRTIDNMGWFTTCETDLRGGLAAQAPTPPKAQPQIGCKELMGVFGKGADQLCDQGAGTLLDLLTIDPLAGQKEQARRIETARLARIAELAPSRCSCAARVVGADRLSWGLYAGSARLISAPDDLSSALTQALHSPACAFAKEGL